MSGVSVDDLGKVTTIKFPHLEKGYNNIFILIYLIYLRVVESDEACKIFSLIWHSVNAQ